MASLTISSGLKIPNWTFLTGLNGALESLVLTAIWRSATINRFTVNRFTHHSGFKEK